MDILSMLSCLNQFAILTQDIFTKCQNKKVYNQIIYKGKNKNNLIQ